MKMLSEYDIDTLAYEIVQGRVPEVYYVAHMIEPREGVMDEHVYKSVSRFKVIKVKIKSIKNAYIEYLNYINHKSNYHIEEEECYYDRFTKYINEYVVPNTSSTGDDILPFNPRMPSIIYGYARKITNSKTGQSEDIINPSPIKVKYLNTEGLSFKTMNQANVLAAINNGILNWKYIKLSHAENVDGINYSYVTSDWYILETVNFPRTEMPLINTNQYSAYFMDINDAFNYIEQLEA